MLARILFRKWKNRIEEWLFLPIGENIDPFPSLTLVATGFIPDPIRQWRDGLEPTIDSVHFFPLILELVILELVTLSNNTILIFLLIHFE